jgi:hypothetical protein
MKKYKSIYLESTLNLKKGESIQVNHNNFDELYKRVLNKKGSFIYRYYDSYKIIKSGTVISWEKTGNPLFKIPKNSKSNTDFLMGRGKKYDYLFSLGYLQEK